MSEPARRPAMPLEPGASVADSLADAAWQRWHVKRVAPAPSAASAPRAAEPAPALRQAFEQGRLQGQREAGASAHAEGLAQGHAEGFAQGQAQGIALGREQALAELQAQAQSDAQASLHAQAQGLLALTQSLPLALAAAEEAVAQELTDLALAIARQVMGQALAVDPTLMLGAVRELLQAEPALTGQPQLLLHPEDLPLVREHLAEELQAAGWRLRADGTLERGGCRVLAASGELDARLPTRWQRVAAALACQPVVAHVTPEGA